MIVGIMLCLSGVLWYVIAGFLGGTGGMLGAREERVQELEAEAERREAAGKAPEESPPTDIPALVRQGQASGGGGGAGSSGRPDSDVDTLARGMPSGIVEIEDRDGELARLLQDMDRDLLGDAPATRAVDIGLPAATVRDCPAAAGARYRTGVLFRHGSAGIKGRSLTRIDGLLTLWKACGGGTIHVEPNPQGDTDGDVTLWERRRDEVKYYLLQRRVPAADIAFREHP